LGNANDLFARFGKDFTKGTLLFEEGDTGREMYIIQTGKVEISKVVRDIEKTLVVFGPGEFFGEMATLNNKPRSARAKVIEDSQLLVLDPDTFEAMLANSSEVALRMIKKLAQRVQEANDQIENLLLKDNESKVVTTLIKLAYDAGEEVKEGIKINILLKGLASQVGIEKEKVKEVLSELVKKKIISVTEDALIIFKIQSLTDFLDLLSKREKSQKK
jgi:CRP-like cAMP-binding protein